MDEKGLVSDLTKLLDSEYGMSLVILDKDKERAALNQRISRYIHQQKIYAKPLYTNVTAYCS